MAKNLPEIIALIVFLCPILVVCSSGLEKCANDYDIYAYECNKFSYTCSDLTEVEFYKLLESVRDNCQRTCSYYFQSNWREIHACEVFNNLIVRSSFITQLPTKLLDDFGNLTGLQLENSLITELKHDVFYNLTNLDYVNFNNNTIHHMDASIFENLPKIRTAHLDDNLLTNFTMENLSSITELYIRNNRLISVNLRNLTQLMFLQLDGNLLSDLNDSFSNLPNIAHLGLCNNSLERVDYLDFYGMYNIRSLGLSHNKLTYIDSEALTNMSSLETLDLAYNLLTDLSRNLFVNKTQLKEIKLSHNRVFVFESEALDSHRELRLLDLSHNRLSVIDHDIFTKVLPLNDKTCLPYFELRLDNNRLRWINLTTINSLSSCVKMVNLSYNLLQGTMKVGGFLHNLDVSHNAIEQLHYDEKRSTKTTANYYYYYYNQTIDFSYNRLRTIGPNLFRRFSQLVHLKLHHNRIEKLPYGSFEGLGNLTSLDLSHNSLTQVHPALFSSVPELSAMNLSHNALKQLDMGGIIDELPKLSILDIDFNRWYCDDLHVMLSSYHVKSKKGLKLRSTEGLMHQAGTHSVRGIRCVESVLPSEELFLTTDEYDETWWHRESSSSWENLLPDEDSSEAQAPNADDSGIGRIAPSIKELLEPDDDFIIPGIRRKTTQNIPDGNEDTANVLHNMRESFTEFLRELKLLRNNEAVITNKYNNNARSITCLMIIIVILFLVIVIISAYNLYNNLSWREQQRKKMSANTILNDI